MTSKEMDVKQQDVNMLLAIGIIILIVVDLFMFLNFIEDSLNFGESGVYAGMIICGISFILIIILSVVLLLITYKKIIGTKVLSILLVTLIIILCGFAANILINTPLGGNKLYSYEGKSDFDSVGQTRIYGDYITWNGDDDIYLLKINEENPIKIGPVSHGPVIYQDYVFFEDDNIIYQHTISTGNTKEIVNGSGISLEAYENNIIWYENKSIYLFNLQSEEKKIIESNNVTLPILLSDNYIVWRERIKSFNYTSFDALFGGIVRGYSNAWTKSGIFNFWIYDIGSGEKTKALSNTMQIIYFSEPNIDLYENTIAYANNLSIYTYNILNGENKEIVKHSKANEILSNDNKLSKTGYISSLLLYDNNLIFGEHFSWQFKYDGTSFMYYDISSGTSFELDIGAYDMYENRVVGWSRTFSGTSFGDYDLYLINLNNK